MLDRPVGDGAGQMCLPSDRAAFEDEVVAPGHERRGEAGAEENAAEFRLDGEVKLLDGVQLWEACLAHAALDAGLGSMHHSLASQGEEELVEGPCLTLGTFDELGAEAHRARSARAAAYAPAEPNLGEHRDSRWSRFAALSTRLFEADKAEIDHPHPPAVLRAPGGTEQQPQWRLHWT